MTLKRTREGVLPIHELLGRYEERVARYCLRVLGCPSDAADCTQEVFWRVYRSLSSFRGEASLTTWIYAITRRCCLVALRRREVRIRRETRLTKAAHDVPDRQTGPAATICQQESRDLFRAIFDGVLDEREAHVMVLHYVDGKTTSEIDRELSLSNRSGSRSYLVSARRKLRRPHVLARLRRLGLADLGANS
jgi:RNA polymerase sigma-70 factor (ECF subfamily)